MIEEPCRSTQLAAMKIAKASGSLLSYDPNLRLPLWPSEEAARKEIMSIWNLADVIKVLYVTKFKVKYQIISLVLKVTQVFVVFQISEEEITFLTGGDDPYDDEVVLRKLFHPNLKLLVVSEGPNGCRYYTQVFACPF